MKTRLILIITLLVIGQWAFCYPISPRPLRLLVEESEYIVWAHVVDIKFEKTKSKRRSGFESTVAVLKVHSVLQGEVTETLLKVPYPAGLICPAPPHFEKDTDVLVFLDKEDGVYSVHALSYGTKQLTPTEMAVYKERIVEMQAILKIKNTDDKFIATTEWLVKCAEHPATRHEGVYELSRNSDFMSYYDQTQAEPFQYGLTPDQHQRLRNALYATARLSYSEIGLIDLVYASDAESICKLMISTLRTLDDQQLWYAEALMTRINLFKSSSRTTELIKEYEAIQFDLDADTTKLKKVIQEFLAENAKLM